MRVFGHSLVIAALAVGGSSLLRGQVADAAQVLAAAREALGGEKALSAVKAFTATGRTRQVRGNNLVPIEFEITCELPDKDVRRDEIPAQDTDPTTLGFKGDELIQFPPPQVRSGAGPGPGGGPPPQQRVMNVKQDFARLTLGMFAASFPGYPLTFRYAGEGEAPEGKADIIDAAGPAGFAARLVIRRDTRLPVMLIWQVPAQARPVEYRMYYSDFRDVDGLKLPFRLRRAIAGETVEETTFDRIRINPKIDPRKFEAQK